QQRLVLGGNALIRWPPIESDDHAIERPLRVQPLDGDVERLPAAARLRRALGEGRGRRPRGEIAELDDVALADPRDLEGEFSVSAVLAEELPQLREVVPERIGRSRALDEEPHDPLWRCLRGLGRAPCRRGALAPLSHRYSPPKYPAMYIAPGATASLN